MHNTMIDRQLDAKDNSKGICKQNFSQGSDQSLTINIIEHFKRDIHHQAEEKAIPIRE